MFLNISISLNLVSTLWIYSKFHGCKIFNAETWFHFKPIVPNHDWVVEWHLWKQPITKKTLILTPPTRICRYIYSKRQLLPSSSFIIPPPLPFFPSNIDIQLITKSIFMKIFHQPCRIVSTSDISSIQLCLWVIIHLSWHCTHSCEYGIDDRSEVNTRGYYLLNKNVLLLSYHIYFNTAAYNGWFRCFIN